ncbi:metallophosphoesterase [Desulfococcaceae bacterium HSG8]|nr:metallophosphoesterase [Desulfococcaceae bacterium HSG8]
MSGEKHAIVNLETFGRPDNVENSVRSDMNRMAGIPGSGLNNRMSAINTWHDNPECYYFSGMIRRIEGDQNPREAGTFQQSIAAIWKTAFLLFFFILCMPSVSDADARNEAVYPGKNDNVFYFIHISDIHIGAESGEGSRAEKNFRDILSDIGQKIINPDAVVATGDLTDGTTGETLSIPDGPDKWEWNRYKDIVKDYPEIIKKFYDAPGNHDRYNDISWNGEGAGGYKYSGVRGSESDFSLPYPAIRSGDIEGQYSWTSPSPDGKEHLFFQVNTNDEVGLSFSEYQLISIMTLEHFASDMPVLSIREFADMDKTLSDFRSSPDSGLAFLFGHHSIVTEPQYQELPIKGLDRMPGLYDDEGRVISWLKKEISSRSELELEDATEFPDSGHGWIGKEIGWDEFKWDGKDGNRLTGCKGILFDHSEDSLVIGERDDRGARELIEYMTDYEVSVYIYGHTHYNSVYFVGHPDTQEKAMVINTGALKNDGSYRIIAVDNGAISTTAAEVRKWPVVLITSPADRNLGGGNPYSFSISQSGTNPVRAFIFCGSEYSADSAGIYIGDEGGEAGAMHRVSEDKEESLYHLWEGYWDTSSVPDGGYEINVRAECVKSESSDARDDFITGSDTITVNVGDNVHVEVPETIKIGTSTGDSPCFVSASVANSSSLELSGICLLFIVFGVLICLVSARLGNSV